MFLILFIAACVFLLTASFSVYANPKLYRITYSLGLASAFAFFIGLSV